MTLALIFAIFLNLTLPLSTPSESPPPIVRIVPSPDYKGDGEFLNATQVLRKLKKLPQVQKLDAIQEVQPTVYRSPFTIEDVECLNLISANTPDFPYLAGDVLTLVEGRTFTEAEIASKTYTHIPILASKRLTTEIGTLLNAESCHYPTLTGFDQESYQLEVIGIFEADQQDFFHAIVLPAPFLNHIGKLHEKAFTRYHKKFGSPDFLPTVEDKEIQKLLSAIIVLKSTKDLPNFEKSANEILAPAYEVMVVPPL